MKNSFLFLVFALTLLVQIPFISSQETLSCEEVSPASYETCLQILDSDLTPEEKILLISNLDYSNKVFPDHSYVYEHNTNLEIPQPPQGTQTQDSTYIKNAWAEILTVMPSVLYEEELYVPDNAELLTGFNYQVQIPSDYRSSRHPRTSQGDCKRTYQVIENNAENEVYVDGVYQGKGKLVDLTINSDSEIRTNYKITVSLKIKHYKWREEDGERRCKYWYEETSTDQIEIRDATEVKHYAETLFAEIQTISQYADTTKIYSNFTNSLELEFEDSEYHFHEFIYDIAYTKKPYFVYTLKATDYNQESSSNILKDGSTLLVKNTNECRFKAFDFFQSIENDCSILGEEISLSIKTDKLKYKPNETILVDIIPSDIPVLLTYGEETKETTGSTTFIANSSSNKISAKYKDATAEKVIFLVNKERTQLYWDLSIFGLLNYCIYAFLRNGIRRIL